MIDLARNQGTVMSGYVSIPKPKGVKKGWQKHFAVITGNRLILFPLKDTKNQEVLQVPNIVVDLKDRFLTVEKVVQQVDLIFTFPSFQINVRTLSMQINETFPISSS